MIKFAGTAAAGAHLRQKISRSILAALLITASASASAQDEAPALEPPISYVDACSHDGADPIRVTLVDTAAGPIVTVRRRGGPALETRDANLAHKSRRLFFQLRTENELIEFQGHATAEALDGLLSDAHGARRIALPSEARVPARCGDKQ